jgi:hypothetical protein
VSGADDRAAEQLAAPVVIESGRYALFEAPSGLMLARAIETCERCRGCGCGTALEPMPLPDPRKGRAHLMGWLVSNAKAGPLAAVTRMLGSE